MHFPTFRVEFGLHESMDTNTQNVLSFAQGLNQLNNLICTLSIKRDVQSDKILSSFSVIYQTAAELQLSWTVKLHIEIYLNSYFACLIPCTEGRKIADRKTWICSVGHGDFTDVITGSVHQLLFLTKTSSRCIGRLR